MFRLSVFMINVKLYYCLGPVHLQFKNVYISAGADVGQVVRLAFV